MTCETWARQDNARCGVECRLASPKPPAILSRMPSVEKLADVVAWRRQNLTGDEKGEAQIFTATDRHVDALVYDLYAPTAAEIKLAEGAARTGERRHKPPPPRL